MENYRLRALSVYNFLSFDVDEEFKVLQEICPEERNRNRSQLKHPGVNFRSHPTRELKRNDLGLAANHQRTISCEKTNSVGPGKTETEALELTKNSLSESISQRNNREKLHSSQNRFRIRIRNRFRTQLGETGRLEGKLHLPDCYFSDSEQGFL